MGFVKMFIDKKNFNEREYLCLLFTLRERGLEYTLVIEDILPILMSWMSRSDVIDSLNLLREKGLKSDNKSNGRRDVLADGALGTGISQP
jgi:hypothetical protein